MKVREMDIRKTLKEDILLKFRSEPDTLILNELGLCQGEAIIDVAVINGALHGYEIKSEGDTLGRLVKQGEVYNRVFDTVTIVTGKRHVDRLPNVIPPWWGIIQVDNPENRILALTTLRETELNPNVEPLALVQLLWRDEALNLLKKLGLAKGYSNKTRDQIWKRIADSLPLEKLQFYVREQLKARKNWRFD